jgi:hypothetical protein
MDPDEIKKGFESVFDQALVFHGFADFTRDYDLYAFCTADPRTGIASQTLRLRFTHCVRAEVQTALSPAIWAGSLDERLTVYEAGVDLQGFVWGVNWQCLYPGCELVPDSSEAKSWTEAIGIDFHEALITTNAQTIRLIFSELRITTQERGASPYTVADDRPDFKTPFP